MWCSTWQCVTLLGVVQYVAVCDSVWQCVDILAGGGVYGGGVYGDVV